MSAVLTVTNLHGEVREHPDLAAIRERLRVKAFRSRTRSWFLGRWNRDALLVRRSTTYAPCTMDATVAVATLTLGRQQIRVCAFGDDFVRVSASLEKEVESAKLWLVVDRRICDHTRYR